MTFEHERWLVAVETRDEAQVKLERLLHALGEQCEACADGFISIHEAATNKVREVERERVIKAFSDRLWASREMFDYQGKPTSKVSQCTCSVLSITSPDLAALVIDLNSKGVANGTADSS